MDDCPWVDVSSHRRRKAGRPAKEIAVQLLKSVWKSVRPKRFNMRNVTG